MAFVGDAMAWLSTTLFFFLGAYVGAVSALFLGGIDLVYTVVTGFVRVPFIWAAGLASIYNEPLGAPPLYRRKKKLAEKPLFEPSAAEVNAPAGAPMDYGGLPRRAVAPPPPSRVL